MLNINKNKRGGYLLQKKKKKHYVALLGEETLILKNISI